MYLYHYFDRSVGPFKNISDLSPKEAKMVLDNIKKNKPNSQCAGRHDRYIEYRIYYENILRDEFRKKGGCIERQVPHYMVVEHSPWLNTWFAYRKAGYSKKYFEGSDILSVQDFVRMNRISK